MTDLRFERMAQIVAVAAVGGMNESITGFFVKECELCIRFSEYVKSQVHLNVVRGLYGRSLRVYVEALYFLNGKTTYRDSAALVLQYFYTDLANFLVNNENEVFLYAVVDTELFCQQRTILKVAELRDKLVRDFEKVVNGEIPVQAWEYAAVLDYAKDSEDVKKKAASYALAHEFMKYSTENKVLLESR